MRRGFPHDRILFCTALLLTGSIASSYAGNMPPAMPVEAVSSEKVDAPAQAPAAAETSAEEKTSADADKPAAEKDAPAKEAASKDTVEKDPPAEAAADGDVPADTVKAQKTANIILPRPRPAVLIGPDGKPVTTAGNDDDELPVVDTDETIPLPPYPPMARITMGALQTYNMGEEDSLLDVARYYKLGYVELRAANPKVDPWTPVPGEPVTIPSFHLLPRAQQKGIVVNLAQMRLYYFKTPGKDPVTFPIGIGREGLLTPTGETTIVRKQAGPTWFPTPRMREEKPYLPAAIPPGPNNPLGSHALYLGWPEFRIHGTDKPWAIGRRVSSGCMRMYPEDITALFKMVPVGTKVAVIDQPMLVGWVGDQLYLEANPSKSQNNDIEINGEHEIKGLTDGLKKVITDAAGDGADKIDWDIVKQVVEERLGYPIVIANKAGPVPPPAPPEQPKHSFFKISVSTPNQYNR